MAIKKSSREDNATLFQIASELVEEHPYYGYPTVTKGPIDISKVTKFRFKYIYPLECWHSDLDHTNYILNDTERGGPWNI